MALPVLDILPQLRAALSAGRTVLLQAPPGAGKSTVLPLELRAEPWLAGQAMLVLQPRRVAARAVAARLAEGLGEEVGQTVGYRVRFESKVGPNTRIEVVTEGILTRRVQRDPGLDGVGLVVFDEFHERSVQADLAYALTREVQGALRDDLRVLVMSATLADDLPAKLGAPVIRSEGRAYPVEVRYWPADPSGPLPPVMAGAIRTALAAHAGDVLAFLPGVPEIRRTLALLPELPGVRALPLYGDLPLAEQNKALRPDPEGRRTLVLATSIAETSLTIPGVRVVIDGGLARRAQFDPGTGLTRLVTARVTRDAAEQRAGRAGRVAPGVAYRLWSERTQALLPAARLPEILEADLAPTLLELAQWGNGEAAPEFWLDAPPPEHLRQARELLQELDALEAGRITERGARMLELPTHPRLAHLLLKGGAAGLGPLAADVAALLEERDPLERDAGSDLSDRVSALRQFRAQGRGPGDRAVLARAEQLSKQWRKQLRVPTDDAPPAHEEVGRLIALAYPERVAQLRGGGRDRYKLAGGRGARLPEGDALAGQPYLAIAHFDAAQAEGRIHLAAPLDPAVLDGHLTQADVVRWDDRTSALLARREERYRELVLDHRPLPDVPAEARRGAVADVVRREGLAVLPWTSETRQWRARVGSMRVWRPDEGWPDMSDAALLDTLDDWLTPHLDPVRRRDDFQQVPVLHLLSARLPWPQSGQLDDLAPARLTVPSGSRIRLEYAPDGAPPVLAVKLQELFGLAETPRVNGGRTPVLLHLLSPAGRPVQVTQDLRSFWAGGYFEVRKDLRGRYPKHPWPDDPWTAEPTRRAKPRGTRSGGVSGGKEV